MFQHVPDWTYGKRYNKESVKMAATDKIKVAIQSRGEFETTVQDFDKLMNHYLPASVSDLRQKIISLSGEGCEGHYDPDDASETYCDGMCDPRIHGLKTVTECLMVLAQYLGFCKN